MGRGAKLAPVVLVVALIVFLAGDIFYWYRLARKPSAAATKIPRIQWSTTGDDPVSSAAPIVGRDGTLYVASAFSIRAFDPSRAVKWVYRLDRADPVEGVSLAQDAAGNLYFGTREHLYSLSVSGVMRWQADCPTAMLARNAEGNPFEGDAVYVSCAGLLLALNESDGGEVWSLRNGVSQVSGQIPMAPMMLHNGAFVFNRGASFFAVDREGKTVWTYPYGNVGIGYLLGVGPDDTTYVENSSGELVALDPNGNVKWTFQCGPPLDVHRTLFRAADGTLYLIAARGLLSLTPDGTLQWSLRLGPSAWGSGYTPPVVAPDGVVYKTAEDRVIAISPGGKIIWQLALPGELHHDGFLALAPDDTLYAVMDSSFVHAIQTRNQDESSKASH
jgi:outer membrane protein assembly factor BamB